MKSKSLKKSLFLSVLTMLMLASIAVGGTYAYFTDSVSIDNNVITAGDIGITAQLDDITNSNTNIAKIELSNFAPGDTAEYKLTVTNVGSLDASYMVMLSASDTSLFDALTIKYGDATMELTDGVFQTTWADIASTDPDTAVEKALKITFNAGSGNNYQNTSFAFDINVLATQVGAAAQDAFEYVDDVADFANVVAGDTVVLTKDITGDVTLDKGVDFIFNNHTINGDLTITDNNTTYFEIGSYVGDGLVNGDVVITANNATVIFNSNVTGTKTITAQTDSDSFHFNGSFVGGEGTIEVAGGKAVISSDVANVNVVSTTDTEAKAVKIVVEAEGTIESLVVSEAVTEEVRVEDKNPKGGIVSATNAGIWSVSTDSELRTALKIGGGIKLMEDISFDASGLNGYDVYKDIVLDLNGKTITGSNGVKADGMFDLYGGADMTIKGNGILDATLMNYAFYLYENESDKSVLTIEDGTFIGSAGGIIQNVRGTVNVQGGRFSCYAYNGKYFILNKIDDKKDGTEYVVTGGTFVGFDPSNATIEVLPEDYVAEGYDVNENTVDDCTEYTVCKKVDTIDA